MAALALLMLLLPASRADVPMATWPSCGEPNRGDLCPSEVGTKWELVSYVPSPADQTVREAELALGSGLGLDRALRITAGRWDVLVAVGDTGLDWAETELIYKIHLNTGELPPPQDALGLENPLAGLGGYDLDGNGLVNVADYAADPRVDPSGHPEGYPGLVDAGDLLIAFSDGVDDDGNGYPDDIAGWDFFEDDNDAFHTVDGDLGHHGTGVMEEAAGEGNGGGGSIGTCPNCALLPIRTGDSIITDGTRSAEAIIYAADMGAVSISQALGAMSAPETARQAVAYAYDLGMLVVGAAGDENQYHHNFPATLDDALFVKSIKHDGSGWEGAWSFFNTLNCNNYGPRLTLSAPSGHCATGATARITGMVGLLHSAARDLALDPPLTAGEATQLLTANADDIWLTEEERSKARAYPSDQGWDAFHGYGRANIGRAVERLAAGDIPPEVRILSPRWFDGVDAAQQSALVVEAQLSAVRSSAVSWTLEIGRGVDPRAWEEVASGAGEVDGVLATVDLSGLDAVAPTDAGRDEDVVSRLERVHASGLNLRLRATDADGRVGEARKYIELTRDADLLPGFPLSLGSSLEAPPILADLVGGPDDAGDGVFELVLATASGELLVMRGDGSVLPGFPVQTDVLDRPWTGVAAAYTTGGVTPPRESIVSAPAVGDIDGDGRPELVVGTLEGRIWAWHVDGSLVDGFPYTQRGRDVSLLDEDHLWDRGFMGAPALADIDGDGVLDIVIGGGDSYLYVVDGGGQDVGPYPVELCHPTVCKVAGARIIASPTVDDIDGDGDIDIILGSNEGAYGGAEAVTHGIDGPTGQPLDGFPWTTQGLIADALLLPLVGEGHPGSTAVADLDGDGDLELLDPVMLGQTDLVHHDGSLYLELPYLEPDYAGGSNVGEGPSLLQLTTHPSFGDMDGDGVPDALIGGSSPLWLASLASSGWMDAHHPVAAWSGADGGFLPGWPRQVEDLQFLMAPAIADISGDGLAEAIYASGGQLVHAWDAQGLQPDGWPKATGQWIMGSPAVGDIDGDGWLDVVVTTREGQVWAWSTAGRADQPVQWQSVFHDARNTGSYQTPLLAQAGPDDVDSGAPVTGGGFSGGCGNCKDGGGDSGAALLLLPGLLGLSGLRRRR